MLTWSKFSAESRTSHSRWNPVFTKYLLDFSRGQIYTLDWGVKQRGSALIWAAYGGWKQWSINWTFHHLEIQLINIETIASGWSSPNEEDKSPSPFGSHLSVNILTCYPSPTLHLASATIKCLDFKMLCQAKDPEDIVTSKMDPWGKYLALNTL